MHIVFCFVNPIATVVRKVWLREAPEIGRATRGARRKAVGIGRAASDIHRPIARGRRLAPEENQENPGGSLREARGAWFDRLTTPRKIEGKEVAEAQSNRDGECAITISPSRTLFKPTQH